MKPTETAVTIATRRDLELLDRARSFIANSKADNTKRSYRSDWNDFTAWCKEHGYYSLPATADTVALYIADRAGTKSVSTIIRRLAAISKAHQASGHDSPCAMKNAKVKDCLDGIKRAYGMAQKGKDPLLTDDVRRLLADVPDSLAGKRDRSLLLIGFAGAFRRSELVALSVDDVDDTKDGLKVTLRRSKTDQEGRGREIGIPYASDPSLCPVRSLQSWLAAAGIVDGAIFRAITRHGRVSSTALGAQVVLNIVKKYCKEAGMDPTKFAAHSLRSGFVTQASMNDATESSIMLQTGHKSVVMVRRYVRSGNLFRNNAAARLGL